jgi:hypothetical protein
VSRKYGAGNEIASRVRNGGSASDERRSRDLYNSNGYTHGLINATGGNPSINMNQFICGSHLVPPSAFQ